MKVVSEHDRIIMMGHGTPYGLLNTGSFIGDFDWNIIDGTFAEILRSKETVSIWCNSNKFFEFFHIGGFHTGMIISETSEESFVLGHIPLDNVELLANMKQFSTIIRDCIDLEDDPNGMKDYVLTHYNNDDEVTQYNRENIIVIDSDECREYYDEWLDDWIVSNENYQFHDDWIDE